MGQSGTKLDKCSKKKLYYYPRCVHFGVNYKYVVILTISGTHVCRWSELCLADNVKRFRCLYHWPNIGGELSRRRITVKLDNCLSRMLHISNCHSKLVSGSGCYETGMSELVQICLQMGQI